MTAPDAAGAPFVVLHIPHASREIPQREGAAFLLSGGALAREVLRMTDHYTDELFDLNPRLARSVVFPVSRLVVDPERFLDDAVEPMAARGMGVLYTDASDRATLRAPFDPPERERLIDRYYRPHHGRLTRAVDAALAAWGGALVVDCHSFASVPLPYEPDQSPDRPEICLGTDAYHSPPALVDAARVIFEDAGFRVALDRPFAGALVPARHFRRDARVMALMIEVNRGLYMDEATGERSTAFSGDRTRVLEALTRVAERAREIAGRTAMGTS